MISPDTIERVRRETSIVALVGETVKLTKKGRNWVGLCPFHQEKTGSFNVNEERGFYHCFGCQVSGDAIKWVRETQGLEFADAIRHLAERAGIPIVESGSETDRRQVAEARKRRDELYAIGDEAAAFFERALHDHPLAALARAELARRELVPREPTDAIADTLQAFRVGYAPYGWDALAVHLRSRGLNHLAAEAVGLLRPRTRGAGHYDVFRHRLMFSVIDTRGRVVAFSGRALDEPPASALREAGVEAMTATETAAKYYNSPESPIFRKGETVFGLHQARSAIHQAGRCIVVEGNFDVVSLHARGMKNVVAPLGTAFTAEQAKLLKRFSPEVVLLFDGDDAGRRAARKARTACREAQLHTRVATLPEGKDPDEMSRGGGVEALESIVTAARSMLEYLIDSTLDRGFTASDPTSQAAKIKEVTDLVAEEQDPTARALAQAHADAIAERLGLADVRSLAALRSAVTRSTAGPNPQQGRPEPPERARSRIDDFAVGRAVLGVLLDFPELLDDPDGAAVVDLLEGDVAAAIAALRQAGWGGGAISDPAEMLANLPASIHPFAAARLAAPVVERIEAARRELLENLDKLKAQELKRDKAEALEAIQRAARSGDVDKEIALLREQERRARERYGV